MALVATALIAALPARAQQPQQDSQAQREPQAPTEQPFPERVIDGIRSFFRSLFGQDKNEPATPSQAQPQEPQSPSQSPAQSQAEDSKGQETGKRGGASYAQPVAVTPHASPSLSLQGAIARGDYGILDSFNTLLDVGRGPKVNYKLRTTDDKLRHER